MNVIAPEVIESESQILMDFELPFSEKENHNSLDLNILENQMNKILYVFF